MLPEDLRQRRERLQKALAAASDEHEFVSTKEIQTQEGDIAIEFRSATSLKPAPLQLWIWEQFRDIDLEPRLYAFKYQLTEPSSRAPIFRYECHPDTVDDDGAQHVQKWHSPYGFVPHFHPDKTSLEQICRLHFPFHRSERREVVFSLIEWMRVDLIRRFYSEKAAGQLSGITVGMTESQVTEALGEPSSKAKTSWVYENRGTVTFKGGRVSSLEVR